MSSPFWIRVPEDPDRPGLLRAVNMGTGVAISGPWRRDSDPPWCIEIDHSRAYPEVGGETVPTWTERITYTTEDAARSALKSIIREAAGEPPVPPEPIPSDLRRLWDAMMVTPVPALDEERLRIIVDAGIDRFVLDMFLAAWNQVHPEGDHG